MGGWLSAADNNVVTIFGGGIWSDLNAFHNVQITISAGEIRGSVVAGYSSQITISGGVIRGNLLAADNSQLTISGGTIGNELRVGEEGRVAIYGTGFNYGYGSITHTSGAEYTLGTLTGTLASGEAINTVFKIYDGGTIVLAPEPATILLFGLGAALLRKYR